MVEGDFSWDETKITRRKFRFPLQFSFRSVWNLSASSQWPTPYKKIKTSTRHNLQAVLGSGNYRHDFQKNTSRKLLGDISSLRGPWARWRVLILLVDVWTQPSPPWDWPLAPETGLENTLLPIFRQPSLSLELFSLRHAQRKKNCLLAKVINQINQQQKEKIYFLMKLTSNLQINLFLIRPAFFTPCPRSLSGMLCNISQEERRESVFPWCILWEGFFLRRKLTNYPCPITGSY